MDKQVKEKILFIFLIVVVFVLPNIFLFSRINRNDDRFFESLGKQYENCVEKAKVSSVDDSYCREVRIASENTYFAADNSIEILWATGFAEMFLFMFIIGSRKLRQRVEELEEKLNV